MAYQSVSTSQQEKRRLQRSMFKESMRLRSYTDSMNAATSFSLSFVGLYTRFTGMPHTNSAIRRTASRWKSSVMRVTGCTPCFVTMSG